MKKLAFLILGLISTNFQAQILEETIKRQYTDYSQLVIDKNVDAALNYTMEDIFEIIPREQMKTMMESVYNMPSVEFKMGLPTYLKLEPVKVIDGVSYVRMRTGSMIELKFTQDPAEPKRTDEEEKEYGDMLRGTFEDKYGKENVSYDQLSGFYKINTVKLVVARSKDEKNWKFAIVDNPRMVTLLEKFIPKELLVE